MTKTLDEMLDGCTDMDDLINLIQNLHAMLEKRTADEAIDWLDLYACRDPLFVGVWTIGPIRIESIGTRWIAGATDSSIEIWGDDTETPRAAVESLAVEVCQLSSDHFLRASVLMAANNVLRITAWQP